MLVVEVVYWRQMDAPGSEVDEHTSPVPQSGGMHRPFSMRHPLIGQQNASLVDDVDGRHAVAPLVGDDAHVSPLAQSFATHAPLTIRSPLFGQQKMSETELDSGLQALLPVTLVSLHVRPLAQRGDVDAGAVSGRPGRGSSSDPSAGSSGSSGALSSMLAPFVPDRACSGSFSSSAGATGAALEHAMKEPAMSATATIRTFSIDFLRSPARRESRARAAGGGVVHPRFVQ